VRILLTGDLIVDEPDPGSYFAPTAELLRGADVTVGHVEVPHTSRPSPQGILVPAPPAEPAHLDTLARVGIDVATLAGNHIGDSGPPGVEDTIARLHELGIATAGAGMTIEEARAPAIVNGVGVLSYNCVGPTESWATSRKAGAAYLEVLTHYELDYAGPGGPPTIYTFTRPASLALLREDIAALRPQVDVVVVALHKGLGHVPAQVAMYEIELGHAAVDAGADIVVGHHAHILRGIEVYRGKPVYHGLGNFVAVTHALTPSDVTGPELVAWAKRRKEQFGFEPDPAMPFYPFHPESRNTILGDVRVEDGVIDAGFVPCWIDDAGRPVPDARATEYVIDITGRAGFATSFQADGERVTVSGSSSGP